MVSVLVLLMVSVVAGNIVLCFPSVVFLWFLLWQVKPNLGNVSGETLSSVLYGCRLLILLFPSSQETIFVVQCFRIMLLNGFCVATAPPVSN